MLKITEILNYKAKWLKQQTDLRAYLMLLADKHIDVTIEIEDDYIWKNTEYAHLLDNLGLVEKGESKYNAILRKTRLDVDDAEQGANMRIEIVDRKTHNIVDKVIFSYSIDDEAGYSLKVNNSNFPPQIGA